MIGLTTITKIIPIVISNKVSIIINRSPFVNAPAKGVLYVSIQNNFLTCNCSLYLRSLSGKSYTFFQIKIILLTFYEPASFLFFINLNYKNVFISSYLLGFVYLFFIFIFFFVL